MLSAYDSLPSGFFCSDKPIRIISYASLLSPSDSCDTYLDIYAEFFDNRHMLYCRFWKSARRHEADDKTGACLHIKSANAH